MPFYRGLLRHVAAHGMVVVQSTSPYFAPRAYWSIDATLKEAGFRDVAVSRVRAVVRRVGLRARVAATRRSRRPTRYRLPMRFLDAETTREMFRFPADMPRPVVEANRLNNQSLVRYFDEDWHQFIR